MKETMKAIGKVEQDIELTRKVKEAWIEAVNFFESILGNGASSRRHDVELYNKGKKNFAFLRDNNQFYSDKFSNFTRIEIWLENDEAFTSDYTAIIRCFKTGIRHVYIGKTASHYQFLINGWRCDDDGTWTGRHLVHGEDPTEIVEKATSDSEEALKDKLNSFDNKIKELHESIHLLKKKAFESDSNNATRIITTIETKTYLDYDLEMTEDDTWFYVTSEGHTEKFPMMTISSIKEPRKDKWFKSITRSK